MIRLLACFFVFLPSVVFAQGSSDFTIQVFGSSDTEAPTIPVLESVSPVATSQIDIRWGTSTDNFLVAGYVVFRDGVAIATTTALNYSDTGLAASTTYTYQVVAFDGLPNYSALSTSSATTTFAIVAPPVSSTTSPRTEATQARVVVDSFAVQSGTATATIELETRDMSRIEVRLGVTPTYELSYIVGNSFRLDHDILINDLLPSTKYFFEVIGYTPSGGQTRLRQGSFTTNSDLPPQSPTNVSQLVAEQQGDAVILTYELPINFPTNGLVRVVRNYFGFPQFLNDGLVVYEGLNQRTVDLSAFLDSERVFYTVFVIDPNGLVSSGAVTIVTDQRTSVSIDQPPSSETGGGITSPEMATSTPGINQPPVTDLSPLAGFPQPDDFAVRQSGVVTQFSTTGIRLSSEEPFIVLVPTSTIPGDFKTMVATLSDPRDPNKTFSFLLRLNGDQVNYSAVIAPVRMVGVSNLVVEVFDYDTQVVARYSTTLTFSGVSTGVIGTATAWYWQAQVWLWGSLLVIPLIVLGSIWLIFWKRDQEDEDNRATKTAPGLYTIRR